MLLVTDTEEIGRRIRKYCAARERCVSEVLLRMELYHVPSGLQEKLLGELKSEGFIDEKRYCREFIGSRFRKCNSGKLKIQEELRTKGINEKVIRDCLKSIPEEDYLEMIRALIEKEIPAEGKQGAHPGPTYWEKVATRLIRKGFEEDLVWEMILRKKITTI